MRMYLQTYTVYSSRPDKGNKIDTDKLHFWKSTVLNNSNTNASLRQAVIFFFFFSHHSNGHFCLQFTVSCHGFTVSARLYIICGTKKRHSIIFHIGLMKQKHCTTLFSSHLQVKLYSPFFFFYIAVLIHFVSVMLAQMFVTVGHQSTKSLVDTCPITYCLENMADYLLHI